MKIVSFNLKILVEELERLEKDIENTKDAASYWLGFQNERATYGNTDAAATAYARVRLEERLMELRERMSTVYDFMGDRGLVNFEPPEFIMALRDQEGGLFE